MTGFDLPLVEECNELLQDLQEELEAAEEREKRLRLTKEQALENGRLRSLVFAAEKRLENADILQSLADNCLPSIAGMEGEVVFRQARKKIYERAVWAAEIDGCWVGILSRWSGDEGLEWRFFCPEIVDLGPWGNLAEAKAVIRGWFKPKMAK